MLAELLILRWGRSNGNSRARAWGRELSGSFLFQALMQIAVHIKHQRTQGLFHINTL